MQLGLAPATARAVSEWSRERGSWLPIALLGAFDIATREVAADTGIRVALGGEPLIVPRAVGASLGDVVEEFGVAIPQPSELKPEFATGDGGDLQLSLTPTPDGGMRGRLKGGPSVGGLAVAQQVATRLTDQLSRLSSPAAAYPPTAVDCCLQDLFERQAARSQEAVALVQGTHEVTYRELDERANRLAHLLRERGADVEVLVGVCVERSFDTAVALLGVLKSGAAIVPIDPSYPDERIALMVADGGVRLIVAHERTEHRFDARQLGLISLDRHRHAIDAQPCRPPRVAREPRSLAYVMFTSGSTGRPKAVAVEHHSVVSYLNEARASYLDVDSSSVVLQLSSVGFDPVLRDLVGALTSGARVVLLDEGEQRDPATIVDTIARYRVTALPSAVPSLLTGILDELAISDRELPIQTTLTSAESLLPLRRRGSALERLGILVNHYGATECTCSCTWHRVRVDDPPGRDLVGRPMPNVAVHLLDEDFNPVPTGSPGEIFLAGSGVARGYLARPAQTAERFVPAPEGPPGKRLYRTGDLGRSAPDGSLELLGRADDQVKIRGYRVEPREVEAALLAHDAVHEAAVTAHVDEAGNRELVAYVVHPRQAATSVDELRSFLATRLPEFMVPTHLVALDSLPLGPTGKLDRQRLPPPGRSRPALSAPFVPPQTDLEHLLAGIWREVLGIDQIGIHDDFFALGGHSIRATQVAARVRAATATEVQVRALFERPTIAELASSLDTQVGGTTRRPRLRRRDPRVGRALSFAQERMWFLDQWDPDSAEYVVPVAFRLVGALDREALGQALEAIIDRHDVLRTTYPLCDDEPVAQLTPRTSRVDLPFIDLSRRQPDEATPEALELASREVAKGFDLARGPLLRMLLMRVGPSEHVLLVAAHHIAIDGWSFAIMLRELGELYSHSVTGRAPSLAPLAVQYADYGDWQREWLAGEALAQELGYWRQQLSELPTLDLPTDRPRPRVRSAAGATHRFQIDAALLSRVEAVASEQGATLFMALLGAFQLLLGRYSGQADFAVGTPIAGRQEAELEDLIGLFANTLVMRADLSGDPRFRALLHRVRETALAAYAHQDAPFEHVVRELAADRDLSRTPLFQVLFVLQDAPLDRLALEGLDVGWLPIDTGGAKFDLTLSLLPDSNGLEASIEYRTDLFDVPRIERLGRNYRRLLEAIAENPDSRTASLKLIDQSEERAELAAASGPAPPEPACVHELFEDQADRTPHAPALLFNDQRLTYGELNAQANALARELQSLGIEPEVPVGIHLERSLEMVIAALAVLKAGGAYVPLDPGYPSDRLAYMLEDSGAPVVITRSALPGLPARSPFVLKLDPELAPVALDEPVPQPCRVPQHPAYIIYTSGSTGRPKGVAVSHGAVANELRWIQSAIPLGACDAAIQKTAFSFDVSVAELFQPLIAGARLILARPGGHRESGYIADLVHQRLVTVLHFVPSMLDAFLGEGDELGASCQSLKHVICMGEALTQATQTRFRDIFGEQVALHNMYGPTEAAIQLTHWPARQPRDGATIPIGFPIAGARALVLDDELEPTPRGVPGELYIGGACLARGYWREPALTADRFVPDPHSGGGRRLYRSGDRVRRLEDGALEYLGRVDDQLKIRGHRVEPGEVEAALRSWDEVAEAAVTLRRTAAGEDLLVGYLVASDGATPPDRSEGLRRLKRVLPDYSIPSAFVAVNSLPLSPSGKLDRSGLPSPDTSRPDLDVPFVPPRTATEQQLAAIWSQVLEVTRVGVEDGFFELGGHSLLATKVVSRIRQTLGVDLPVRAIFEASTIAQLAVLVCSHAGRRHAALAPGLAGEELAPVSPVQRRLWLLQQIEPDSSEYNVPFIARLHGALDTRLLERALNALIARHEPLRTRFRLNNGVPEQLVDASALAMPQDDLSERPEQQRTEAARRLIELDTNAPFDLATSPLLRVRLIRIGDAHHLLVVTAHHAIFDGSSVRIFLRDLGALYEAFATRRPPALPHLPVTYRDYSVWQSDRLSERTLERDRSFWQARLEGLTPLELATDFARPRQSSGRVGTHRFALPRQLREHVAELAKKANATPFMVSLAAFGVLLARHADQPEVTIGTPVDGRDDPSLEPLVGCFVNTLALRTEVRRDWSFLDVVAEVRRVTLEAHSHKELPFEEVVEAVQPERDLRRAPLFQVMFQLDAAPPIEANLGDVHGAAELVSSGRTSFDLSLALNEDKDGGWSGTLEYSADLFTAATAARIARRFQVLLGGAVRAPETPAGLLSIMDDQERALLVRAAAPNWNSRRGDILVTDLFNDQVSRQPDAAAIIDRDRTLTYAELDRASTRLARHLLEETAASNPVAICLGRSADLIVALLAALKAGLPYLPLDPGAPLERSRAMLEDAGAQVVVTRDSDSRRLAPACRQICLNSEQDALLAVSPEPLPRLAHSSALAYVLYTSGSTGRPKGVAVEQGALGRFVCASVRHLGIRPGERILQFAAPIFDTHVEEIFPALAGGAALVPRNDEMTRSPRAFLDEVKWAEIAILDLPTAYWHELTLALEHNNLSLPSSVRLVVIGGEQASRERLAQWRERGGPGVQLLNTYGPTEAVVVATTADLSTASAAEGERVPIGRPLEGNSTFILDQYLHLVPIGVPGELHIGGDQLARGYLQSPGLTADRFVPSPFGSGRLYRTGDRVRRREDGDLEFLGRLDDQLKIRGVRVEPAEVERVLAAHPAVDNAVVVGDQAVDASSADLVAYVLLGPGEELDIRELREHVARNLPPAFVPSAFVPVDVLPVTPTGKIDRQSLPTRPPGPALGPRRLVEPRTPAEQAVAAVWRDVLAIDQVGAKDNFFDLGGHSLAAARAGARLGELLDIDLPLRAFFEEQTVERLAARIEVELAREIETLSDDEVVRLLAEAAKGAAT